MCWAMALRPDALELGPVLDWVQQDRHRPNARIAQADEPDGIRVSLGELEEQNPRRHHWPASFCPGAGGPGQGRLRVRCLCPVPESWKVLLLAKNLSAHGPGGGHHPSQRRGGGAGPSPAIRLFPGGFGVWWRMRRGLGRWHGNLLYRLYPGTAGDAVPLWRRNSGCLPPEAAIFTGRTKPQIVLGALEVPAGPQDLRPGWGRWRHDPGGAGLLSGLSLYCLSLPSQLLHRLGGDVDQDTLARYLPAVRPPWPPTGRAHRLSGHPPHFRLDSRERCLFER